MLYHVVRLLFRSGRERNGLCFCCGGGGACVDCSPANAPARRHVLLCFFLNCVICRLVLECFSGFVPPVHVLTRGRLFSSVGIAARALKIFCNFAFGAFFFLREQRLRAKPTLTGSGVLRKAANCTAQRHIDRIRIARTFRLLEAGRGGGGWVVVCTQGGKVVTFGVFGCSH